MKHGLPMRFPNAGFARSLDREGILTTDDILADLGRHSGVEKKVYFINWLRKLNPASMKW